MSALKSKTSVAPVPTVTLHIKNMAGDVISLDVSATMTVQGVAQRLTMMDSTLYPYYRTKVLRLASLESDEADTVPFADGEMLAVVVGDGAVKETGVFPDHAHETLRGKPYTRFLFPLNDILHDDDYKDDEMLYVYPLTKSGLYGNDNHTAYFYLSRHSEPLLLDDNEYGGYILYTMVDYFLRTLVRVKRDWVRVKRGPVIFPEEMKLIQDTVDAYYEALGRENRVVYRQSYDLKETVLCECGALVERSRLLFHRNTKQHASVMGSIESQNTV